MTAAAMADQRSRRAAWRGPFLTVAEVASLMRVSKMTVYRLVHAGDLTAVRVGRSFRVPEHAVHAYLRGAFRRNRLTADAGRGTAGGMPAGCPDQAVGERALPLG